MKKSIFTETISLIRERSFLLSLAVLFLLFLAYYFVWTFLYYFGLEQYEIAFRATPNETIMQESFLKQILLVVILGPLFETLIFQKWFYQLLSLFKVLKRNKIWLILMEPLELKWFG